MRNSVIIVLIAAGLTASCKSRVVFTTHTSLGLDVSGTAQMPNKVSFSYNRYEAAIVPRKTNGEAHSVYGGMDADVKFFGGHTIKQTFATGKAAMLATAADTNGVSFAGARTVEGDHPLIFLTATTYGLHLTAGEQEMSPNMLLGYRRSEATVIPVPEPAQEVRSVYADILINSAEQTNNSITTNFSALRGVRIKQSFATGRAADALAENSDEVRGRLADASGVTVARDIMDRNHQRALWVADEIRKELDRLNNEQLSRAVQAFQTAGIFESARAADINSITDARERCQALKAEADRAAAPMQLPTAELDKLETLLGSLKQIR